MRGEIDVTIPGRDCRTRPGICIHQVASLHRRDVRKLHGIPITTPARTLLDLAATASSRELEQALAETHAGRLVDRNDRHLLLARYPTGQGTRALRNLIEPKPAPP